MKTLATLHAEQKIKFEDGFVLKKFAGQILENPQISPSVKPEDVQRFLKTCTLSQIDLMIEIVESKKKDEHPVDCIDGETPVETYGYEAEYNSALSDLSTLLQAQRKLIEEQ